jgi:CheY-like chemotaxis protein
MHTGLGVGLALAKRLIELHGGTIEARSDGLGLGSAFSVRLPVMAALTSDRGPPLTEDSARHGRPHRILLVDDNVDFVTSLSLLLQSMGHEVRVAHDAGEALAAAQEFTPEFAFLDLGLPRISGYELARELRKLPAAEETVLVALSGWGQPQDRLRSQDAGFVLHLVKPVDLARIQTVLESFAQSG